MGTVMAWLLVTPRGEPLGPVLDLDRRMTPRLLHRIATTSNPANVPMHNPISAPSIKTRRHSSFTCSSALDLAESYLASEPAGTPDTP